MGPIYSLGDFLDMVRRRIGLISLVIILGCAVSVIWALNTPHSYRSAEVIQIEQPRIDSDLAPTTVAGSSARRLQLIQQQLMSRDSLLEIIDKFDLYADQPDLLTSEKVDMLRGSVEITGVAAAREGFADDGTISVLTFTANLDSPENARAVAHEFADRTRELSARQRQIQTEETLAFFKNQEEVLLRDIAALEDELAAFRSENDLSIEGSLEFRRTEIANLNESILELDREIIATQLAGNIIDRTRRSPIVIREIEENQARLESLTTQRSLLDERRTALSRSIQNTPEVERALANFERRMNQLQGQLDVIATRRNEAEVGFTLENAARGERLITIEEATIPDYPTTMGRKQRAFMGGIASVMLALALAFLLELRRPVVRTARQMERETGLRPVVSIPDTRFDSPASEKRGLMKLWDARRASGKRGRAARLARNVELFRKG